MSPTVIHEVLAFVAVDSDGNEILLSFRTGDGWFPMVASDRKFAEPMRAIAQAHASAKGVVVRTLCFGSRELVEVFDP